MNERKLNPEHISALIEMLNNGSPRLTYLSLISQCPQPEN